jgi:hypothetical protein
MTLSYNKAIDWMHRGSPLIKTHGVQGKRGKETVWAVAPGGNVTHATALKIISRPDVIGASDSFWPGMAQTWRLVHVDAPAPLTSGERATR